MISYNGNDERTKTVTRTKIYGWVLIILASVTILDAILVAMGDAHFPIWVQVGNTLTIAVLMFSIGLDKITKYHH
jgi:hypothetical protein